MSMSVSILVVGDPVQALTETNYEDKVRTIEAVYRLAPDTMRWLVSIIRAHAKGDTGKASELIIMAAAWLHAEKII